MMRSVCVRARLSPSFGGLFRAICSPRYETNCGFHSILFTHDVNSGQDTRDVNNGQDTVLPSCRRDTCRRDMVVLDREVVISVRAPVRAPGHDADWQATVRSSPCGEKVCGRGGGAQRTIGADGSRDTEEFQRHGNTLYLEA